MKEEDYKTTQEASTDTHTHTLTQLHKMRKRETEKNTVR